MEDVAVEEADSQPAAAANEDNDENAPANAFVRGSWVWRVFQSKQDFSADDFDAYKEKAVVQLECTQYIVTVDRYLSCLFIMIDYSCLTMSTTADLSGA